MKKLVPIIGVPATKVPVNAVLRAVPLQELGDFEEKQTLIMMEIDVPEWMDVSNRITIALTKSKSSSGYYVALWDNPEHSLPVMIGRIGYHGHILGTDRSFGFGPVITKKGYKIEKVPDGTISFKIFKQV